MDIKRDKYLNDLVDRMHNGMIKVVTGLNWINVKIKSIVIRIRY